MNSVIAMTIAWERINKSEESKKESRFEKEARAFHQKIRQGYLSLAGKEPKRIAMIDATLSLIKLHQQIVDILFPGSR